MSLLRYWRVLGVLTLVLAEAGCATSQAARKPSTPAEWRAEMQPPLTEEQASKIAEGLTLPDAIALGLERNPAVAAARQRWFGAIKVEPQAVTPPDPMLQAGYQFESVETRVGPQQSSIGLTQQIPWPQKLWAKGRIAGVNSDIAQLRYEAALRDLIVQTKDSYYELFYLDQALPITEKIEEMLRNDAILAYSELTVGRTQINEAFRAESQAAQLDYDRILLVEQRAAQAERMRSLLNLPPDTEIGPVRGAPTYEVASSIDELFDRAEKYAEILKIRGLETQRAAYETFLAKLSRIPDISLGFSYINTSPARVTPAARISSLDTQVQNLNNALTALNANTNPKIPQQPTPLRPSDSGKDPLIGLFSMNLPIYQWRNRALIQEQKALEQAMRLEAMNDLDAVRAAVAQTYFRARLTERLVKLYDDTLLPQAEAVMNQAEIFFRNDQASFSNVIETTLAYHNFTLARLRAVADHGQAIDRLEQVVGTTTEHRTEPEPPAAPAVEETAR
ncbi:MAG: TolC family protein [Candidatus Hydrogenedentes bacterium]|nr:TolC family protein [Candidatus Hydrogenedentota bacterium]